MNSVLEIKSWKILVGNCCIFEWGDNSRTSQSLETTAALWLLDQTVSNCGVPHAPRVSLHAESLVLREHWHQPRVSYTPTKASWWHFQFLFTLSKSFLFDFFKVVDISLGKGTAQNKFFFHQDSNFLSKQLKDFFYYYFLNPSYCMV